MSDPKKSLYAQNYHPVTFLDLAMDFGVNINTAQSGEDVILLRLFQKKSNGFYIDVGAYHPIRLSNTYLLHKLYGWQGINIDASSESINNFKQSRPNDINIHIAVSDQNGEATFHIFEQAPAVNTITDSNIERQSNKGLSPTRTETVQTQRLEDILDSYLPANQPIDLLTIDAEGVDLEVLKSNNWEKYRPSVVLVEDFNMQIMGGDLTPIRQFVESLGYRLVSHAFDTSIYADQHIIESLLNGKKPLSQPVVYALNGDVNDPVNKKTAPYIKAHPQYKAINDDLKQSKNELAEKDKRLNQAEKQNDELTKSLNYNVKEITKLIQQLFQQLIQQKELELTTQQAIAEKEHISNHLAELLETHNQHLRQELQKRKDRIKKTKDETERFRKDIANAVQATQSILNSRSFRYVTWIKNKLRPSSSYPADNYSERLLNITRDRDDVGVSVGEQATTQKAIAPTGKIDYYGQHKIVLERLYSLGLTERALQELEINLDNPHRRRVSAWSLALWYTQFEDTENIQKTLKYLAITKQSEKDPQQHQRIAIIESEAYFRLGQVDKAKNLILEMLAQEVTQDLLLTIASYETTIPQKLEWINKALALDNIEPLVWKSDKPTPFDYDQLGNCEVVNVTPYNGDVYPKVTVIIPNYNSADIIATALDSLLNQTWQNIEILVVDDRSTDHIIELMQDYMQRDSRVKFIQVEENGGPYIGRNIALQHATGEFVTCNDADDWSHPRKIEVQARHLIANPDVVANMTKQSRLTNDFTFYKHFKNSSFVHFNLSSIMFRREKVVSEIGYWDSVRFSADAEFMNRLKRVYGGRQGLVILENTLLSFQRQSSRSLTAHDAFGYWGFHIGARKEYAQQFAYFYDHTDDIYIGFPLKERPFAVPNPMLPNRIKPGTPRHFDVIIMSDFRFPGGTTSANAAEIKAYKQAGLKVGLVQVNRYHLNITHVIKDKIRELIDGKQVEMVVYGESATCDLLVIQHPSVFQDWQRFMPEVNAKRVHLIVNQTPYRDYSGTGEREYDISSVITNMTRYFGHTGIWYPIGPVIRKALEEYHKDELTQVDVSDDDWYNIIDIEEWKRPSRPARSKHPRIGRHSRDQYVKWPEVKDVLLGAYPDDPNYEVHILGGAAPAEKTLGYLPKNWHIIPFDVVEPKDFLATLDVFVYYTHSAWVESFGRVIFEAMAVGVPVILPYLYRDVFEDAAIYAEPHEVKQQVDRLMNDDAYYDEMANKAMRYVDLKFGYAQHIRRLEGIVESVSKN